MALRRLLEKIQAAEKRLRTRQKAVEAAIVKRDQLQHSLQAAQEKLHEALTLRREQEAELMNLLAQVAADLPLAASTPVRSQKRRKTIMEALGALSKGEVQLQKHMRGALAMDTDFDEVARKRKDTLDASLSK